MELSNRTVLVTGGTGGIGLGIAEAFYRSGSRVIVCGRDPDRLLLVEKNHPGITALRCDLGDAAQREKLCKDVLDGFPGLDTLVNNAGIQRYIDLKKGYGELRSGENEIEINFVSLVELTALFIPHLMKKSSSAIINLGSGLGFMPMVNMPVYCATKAAAHIFTVVLREQLKKTSVRVVEIVPPMVDTGLNRKGREGIGLKYRGISVQEYIPSVVRGLEGDADMIFHGEGAGVMSESREKIENRLLNPSW
jgi:uncharacterized oxidoreductase